MLIYISRMVATQIAILVFFGSVRQQIRLFIFVIVPSKEPRQLHSLSLAFLHQHLLQKSR
jgi:hypothetical protein